MEKKSGRLYSILEVEGKFTSHDTYLKKELSLRKDAYQYINDVELLAHFLGAGVFKIGVGEDWAILKEVFPGVGVVLSYRKEDPEFPSDLRVLFQGDRIPLMRGEDLAALTIAIVNHGLRYIRENNPQATLPQICYNV